MTTIKLWRLVYLFCTILSALAIWFMLTRKIRFTTILVLGSLLLAVGMVAGLVDVIFFSKGTMSNTYYARYVEFGVIGELVFLNYGLFYKNRETQSEKIQLEFEKY